MHVHKGFLIRVFNAFSAQKKTCQRARSSISKNSLTLICILLALFISFQILPVSAQANALAIAPLNSQEWNVTFGGPGYELASSVQFTGDGYILAGSTGYVSETNGGEITRDALLIKTDLSGNEEWNKTYGGPKDDFANFVVIDPLDINNKNKASEEKGYLLVGSTASYSIKSNNTTELNVWLIKTDSSGNELWNKTIMLPISVVRSVKVVSDGYIFTGEVSDKRYSDIKMLKTNFDGVVEWNKSFGGTLGDYAHAIIEETRGGFVVVGNKWDYSKKESHAWILKTDSDGKEEWIKTFGGKGTDVISSIIRLSADSSGKNKTGDLNQNYNASKEYGYLVAGFTDSFGNGRKDAWIVFLDSDGNEKWNQTFGGILDDAAYSIISTPDGFAFAGHTESFGNKAQAWLVKFNVDTDFFEDINSEDQTDESKNPIDKSPEKEENVISLPGFGFINTGIAIITALLISCILVKKKQ